MCVRRFHRFVLSFCVLAGAIAFLAIERPVSADAVSRERLRAIAAAADEYACCLLDGACAEVAEEQDCDALGGAYQGDGTQCALVSCPQPGACCLSSGVCMQGVIVGGADCVDAGGHYQGDDTVCAIDSCARSSIEKGSLVVFPQVELRWDAAGALVRDTFLSLTNDYPEDVSVLLYFVNGDPPLAEDVASGERAHPGWNWLDIELRLTANQPTYWSAITGQPAAGGVSPFAALDPGAPPGRPALDGSGDRVLRGFVIGWAVDPFGEEIRWDHLVGEATVVDYRGGAGWTVPTINHAVASEAAHGSAPDPEPGVLHLDGAEYDGAFAALMMGFQAVGSAAHSGPRLVTSATDLALLPLDLDLRQETTGPTTTDASINVWNMNEVKFSGARRCVTCWDAAALGSYPAPNHFRLDSLQTDQGTMRIDGRPSAFCFDPVLGAPATAAAIWAITVRHLRFDGGLDIAASAAIPAGTGFEPAVVRFDPVGAPPILDWPSIN